jgi:hypothetical protein
VARSVPRRWHAGGSFLCAHSSAEIQRSARRSVEEAPHGGPRIRRSGDQATGIPRRQTRTSAALPPPMARGGPGGPAPARGRPPTLTQVAQLDVAKPRFLRESCCEGCPVFTTKRDRYSSVQVASDPTTPEFGPARPWAGRPDGGRAASHRSFPTGCRRQRPVRARGG